jgi:CRP-like cAMP-binding protein
MFLPFTAEELKFMQRFKVAEEVVSPRATVLHQGERSPVLYTVLDGFGRRSILLEDGRRQVVNFVFPGDFLGLQAAIMGEMKHSVEATSEMRLCVFERTRLWEMFRDRPERAFDLTWIAAVEEHFLGETVATLGQRDAVERMAWALLRIWRRLCALGLLSNGSVPLPFRQNELADALGLSVVHTSRTLSILRREELVEWTKGRLRVIDHARLSRIAALPIEVELQRPLM